MGRLPLVLSYVLISLKTYLIQLFILTHTHTHTHQHTSSNQRGINHPKTHTSIMATHIKPSVHLSYISYHFIQGSKQIKISHGHGNIKELLESIKNIKNTNIFQVHISYPNQMHVHMNACLTSFTLLHHSTYASMHDHIICMFMAKQ